MGLFIHKIKDYETTDYRKYQQACGNPGTGYRNTYADRKRYHAYIKSLTRCNTCSQECLISSKYKSLFFF